MVARGSGALQLPAQASLEAISPDKIGMHLTRLISWRTGMNLIT